jgi:hypothetical protein
VLVGEGRVPFSSESKRVDDFAAMTDEELRAYVYGKQPNGQDTD